MRLFLAVELNNETIRKIDQIENEFKVKDLDIRFVEPKNLHITLKFLGEVDESKMNDVVKKISDDLSGVKQFRVNVEGFGYFGKPNYIRTLWVDIKEGKEQLVMLIKRFNKSLNHIRSDSHKPNPHITIGRIRSGRNKDVLLHETITLRNVKFGELHVKEIKLKKSTLTPKGPLYEDVKVFKLK